MANVKISDLGAATDIADADQGVILDVSDTSQAATGTTKKVVGSILRGSKILTGAGAPSNGLGNNGDFYVDTVAPNSFYTKSSGTWTSQGTLAGSGLGNVVEDLSPQLGGALDVNGQSIVSVSNGNIAITPNGTGSVILDGITHPQADGTANQVLATNGSGVLSFSTRLSAVSGDSSPSLGGNLNVAGNSIVSVSNGNINITPNGTGSVVIDGISHPQADGTNGQALITNGSGVLSFGTVSSQLTPSTVLELYDDFISSNEDTDEIGAYGWRSTSAGTGNAQSRLEAISGRPGIYRITAGTTATSRSLIYLGESGFNSIFPDGGVLVFETVIRLTGTLTGFSRFNAGLAIPNLVAGANTNGIYFEFATGDTNWQLVGASSSVYTRQDTGIPVVSGNWYKLRFTTNAAWSSIQANINGTNAGSPVTSNIPIVALSPMYKTDGILGGTSVPCDIDYFYLRQTLTNAR